MKEKKTNNYTPVVKFYKIKIEENNKPKREDFIEDKVPTPEVYVKKYFKVLWIHKGQGSIMVDFTEFPVEKDLIYCASPSQQLNLNMAKMEGLEIVISVDFYHTLFDHTIGLLFSPYRREAVKIDKSLAENLDNLLLLIKKEYEYEKNYKIISLYLKTFLSLLSREKRKYFPDYDAEDKRIQKLFYLVEANFIKQRNVEFYATQIGITPKRINEILKKQVGMTLTRILHIRLIFEAKRQISQEQRSLKNIAYDLGFSEQGYFSRFFKKMTGLRPEDFRQAMFKLSK